MAQQRIIYLDVARAVKDEMVTTAAGFFAPESYLIASVIDRAGVCNGAGTRDFNVPDKPFGVDFAEPANVHDWMTHLARSRWEKIIADAVFFINMILAVVTDDVTETNGNPARVGFLTRVRFIARLKVATVYFLAVWRHGVAENAGIIPWWRRVLSAMNAVLDRAAWPLAVLCAVARVGVGRKKETTDDETVA